MAGVNEGEAEERKKKERKKMEREKMERKTMEFNHDEKMLLLLYQGEDKTQTIQNLEDMKKDLLPEENELRNLTDSVIGKMETISEEKFASLSLFDGFTEEE